MKSQGIAVFLVTSLLLGAPAWAEIRRVSHPQVASSSWGPRHFDVAYDSINGVRLLVTAGSSFGLEGCLFFDSSLPQKCFDVAPEWPSGYYPRVAWSSEQGTFLVSYLVDSGPCCSIDFAAPKARVIRVVNGAPAMGPEISLGFISVDVSSYWLPKGGGIAYSPPGGKFLVTWTTGGTSKVHVIDPIGNGALVSTRELTESGDQESDPVIACESDRGKCLVAGRGINGSTYWTWGRFVDGTTGAPLGPHTVSLLQGPAGVPSVVYSPETAATPAGFLVGMIASDGVLKGVIADGRSETFGTPFTMLEDPTQDPKYLLLSMRYSAASQTIIAAIATGGRGPCVLQEFDGLGRPTPGGFGVIHSVPSGHVTDRTAIPAMNSVTGDFYVYEKYPENIIVTRYAASLAQAAPRVTRNPYNRVIHAGWPVSFTAAALGAPAPTVQWEASGDGGATWVTVPGASTTTQTFTATAADSGKQFRARFTNGLSPDAISAAAVLTIGSGGGTDFDDDARAEFLLWTPGTGMWRWASSSATGTTGESGVQWGNQALGDVSLTDDIDGDGLADLVIWRASTGTWYWLTSSSHYAHAAAGGRQWGNQSLGDIPILADFDGDRRADLGIWRASTGTWYWLTSSSGYSYASAQGIQWGNADLGDRPFAADFDGDGLSDLAIWRASTGTWYWLTSSTGYAYSSAGGKQWGSADFDDVPMVGDLDGDGLADLVVWRAATGTWYWLTSSSGYSYDESFARQWGNAGLGDVARLADFEGDGTPDLVVWRETTGQWFWLASSSAFTESGVRSFGNPGDVPVVR
jgi:hypothetical protein